MTGFLEISFLVSACMSDYCGNTIRKLRHQPGKSKLSFQSFKNQPKNWGRLMHGVHKRASDLREDFARGAETCLRIGADFCTGCINVPQIWGKILHGVHKRASVLGEDFARGA